MCHAIHSAVHQPFHLNGGTYRFGDSAESHLILPPFLHGREGSSFPGCFSPNNTVNSKSVVGIKLGDSFVLIGCQFDECTYNLSVECFIVWSYIYPGVMGQVSTPIHFPLEPGCEDCFLFDQAVNDLEHHLNSILRDTFDTPELDATFDEADALPSSVSSGLLCLVSTISGISRLQFASSIKFHKLWCQAMHYFHLSHILVKCQSLS